MSEKNLYGWNILQDLPQMTYTMQYYLWYRDYTSTIRKIYFLRRQANNLNHLYVAGIRDCDYLFLSGNSEFKWKKN